MADVVILQQIFENIDKARIGVIGDFCLDAYWLADMKKSVLSRETPHYPLPVIQERMSPGGAGNVACNIAALCPQETAVLGVIGNDWRGDVLLSLLNKEKVNTAGLVRTDQCVTNAYIKPLRMGQSDVVYEDPRLDFENYTLLDSTAEEELTDRLLRAAGTLDVLCVCDQMRYGCITPRIRECITGLSRKGLRVIVDSRERIGLFRNVIIKPNAAEAAQAVDGRQQDGVLTIEELSGIALRLSRSSNSPAVVTLGERGCLVAEDDQVIHIPAEHVEPPIDICGAGDTFLAALACALAGGTNLSGAAKIGNAASGVVVKMLHTTGVASRERLAEALEKEDVFGECNAK